MSTKFFGQFLLEVGAITGPQLLEAVNQQSTVNIKLGTRAIDAGFMMSEDVEEINLRQRREDRRFGELAVEAGFLTEQQLKELLGKQKDERLLLGQALVNTGALEESELNSLLERFQSEVQPTPGTLAELFVDLPNAELLETVTDVACKMFQRVLHVYVKADSCQERSELSDYRGFTLSQGFRGQFKGMVRLRLSESMLDTIGNKMLSDDPSVGAQDTFLDAATEFLNIISGNICAALSNAGRLAEIKPPTFHNHEDGPAEPPPAGQLRVIPLRHPTEQIELHVIDAS